MLIFYSNIFLMIWFTFLSNCDILLRKEQCKMNNDFSKLTKEEKNMWLFEEQKKTLDLFLERGAITKAQYDKSLGDLVKNYNTKL